MSYESEIKKCSRCSRKLEESERLMTFPGEIYWDVDARMYGGTSKKVCEKCYKELSGEGLICIKDEKGDWVYPEEIGKKDEQKTD
ncbi:hypothetical protein HOA55_04965 [archaeon]|jgi:hypothetical protein|nr:hypothetical protein [archaeon]MBT3578131.1 hypothetical protein [archaeon]MBT6820679.1 hypothetical protein [archaeon]MBT7024911.1 hypothetical protein [archaeon]MBT7238530.1 hypothetical protein [archaeon]